MLLGGEVLAPSSKGNTQESTGAVQWRPFIGLGSTHTPQSRITAVGRTYRLQPRAIHHKMDTFQNTFDRQPNWSGSEDETKLNSETVSWSMWSWRTNCRLCSE
ncbi:hypothetical protein AOLI_G00227670 [Acnodon oligacanthus]